MNIAGQDRREVLDEPWSRGRQGCVKIVMMTIRLKILWRGVGIAALIVIYCLFNPLKAGFFPRCPFNVLTGLYCPGCGSQRAFHALLHGRVLQAAGYNLLAVLLLPFVLYSAIAFAGNHLWRLGLRQDVFYKPWFAKAVLGLVVAFWVLRNLPVPCFRWMAP